MTKIPNGPWENLRADLFGPLPSREYVLVIQCLYSRFPAVEIVSSTSATAVIPANDKILTNFGIPYKLGSDNGPLTAEPSQNLPTTWVFVTLKSHHMHHGQMALLNTLCAILARSSGPPTFQIRAGNHPCKASSDHTEQHHTAQQVTLQPSCFNNRQYYKTCLPNEKTETELYQH
ncbi:uncharacterized protein [Clytia hemisphaerica]|uniref:uncharacterized protein n=1 Tax=Clytia hemisphaerica TaxID=252671 RepID=UPI0034D407EB